MDTILFVCTGNTCRSPMAEAIAQRWLDEQCDSDEPRHLAASAGVAATDGSLPSPEAVRALADLRIEHEGRSKRLTAEMISSASAVLCMTASHVEAARALVAGDAVASARVALLDPNGDIEDPIGMGQDAYTELAQRFTEIIPRRLKELVCHEDRAGI